MALFLSEKIIMMYGSNALRIWMAVLICVSITREMFADESEGISSPKKVHVIVKNADGSQGALSPEQASLIIRMTEVAPVNRADETFDTVCRAFMLWRGEWPKALDELLGFSAKQLNGLIQINTEGKQIEFKVSDDGALKILLRQNDASDQREWSVRKLEGHARNISVKQDSDMHFHMLKSLAWQYMIENDLKVLCKAFFTDKGKWPRDREDLEEFGTTRLNGWITVDETLKDLEFDAQPDGTMAIRYWWRGEMLQSGSRTNKRVLMIRTPSSAKSRIKEDGGTEGK